MKAVAVPFWISRRAVLSDIANSFMREIVDGTLKYAGGREVFGSTLANMPVWHPSPRPAFLAG